MSQAPTPIAEYRKTRFEAPTASGTTISHDIYRRGAGAPVVIIQELPGIGQETLHLADQFVEGGFSVVLPHLFGPIGKISIAGNLARVFCMRKEFALFAANRSSPIVDWLKALCRQEKAETGASGVATIGMCLTGNFAISLMADESVLAAVASQPSMPLGKSSALHMSEAEIATVRNRIDATAPVMALRFEGDKICNGAKFKAYDKAFNDDGERVLCKTLPGPGHSVLTLDFVDQAGHPTREALDGVMAYFRRQLAV